MALPREEYPRNINIGPPKDPADIVLAPIVGAGSEEDQERLAQRNIELTRGIGNIGPEKDPADIILAEKFDPIAQEIYTKEQAKRPVMQDRLAQERSTTEFLLGATQGTLYDESGVFADVARVANTPGLRTGEYVGPHSGIETTDDDVQIFQSVEDFEFTAAQHQRLNTLIEQGDIDPDQLFTGPGRSPLEAFGFNQPLSSALPGPNGLTMSQAVEIIVGNDRDPITRFDPNTGFTFTGGAIRRAQDFSATYAKYQGFSGADFLSAKARSNEGDLRFQHFVEGELGQNRYGQNRQRTRDDRLRDALTLNEMIQVQELYWGRSRRVDNPRRSAQRQEFDDTLLKTDSIL